MSRDSVTHEFSFERGPVKKFRKKILIGYVLLLTLHEINLKNPILSLVKQGDSIMEHQVMKKWDLCYISFAAYDI